MDGIGTDSELLERVFIYKVKSDGIPSLDLSQPINRILATYSIDYGI